MKIKILIAILLSTTIFTGCQNSIEDTQNPSLAPSKPVSADSRLDALFENYWQYILKQSPIFATSLGDLRYNDQLPDASLEAIHESIEKEKQFLARLKEIDKTALSPDQKVNYDLFKTLRQRSITGSQFRTYLMPIDNRGGFHDSFSRLPENVPFRTVQHYNDYIARLKQFPKYTADHIERMQKGIELNITPPRITMQGIEGIISTHIVENPTESVFYEPFKNFPDHFTEAEKDQLSQLGQEVIESSIIPAYQELLNFVTETYTPATRETIAASDLPNGHEFYQHRIAVFTTLEMSAEEIHEIGLEHVAQLKTEMLQIAADDGFENYSLRQFVEHLENDPNLYAETPEELLKETALVLKNMDGQLPKLVTKMPRMSYGLKEVPAETAFAAAPAYYMPPSPDGSRAGFFYINTHDLKSQPLWMIEALAYHETVPGHHLQIALQQEMENIPMFRKFTGFTAYAEGWALYAEQLGLEVDGYRLPYAEFGRLAMEIWRASRLVVDTGLHYFGWSRQDAIDYMVANTALSKHNIETEVDRYIAWPGQALSYKIGQLKILELRDMAQEKLGADFNLRKFNDALLQNGAVPLDLLEKDIEKWIENQQSQSQ